MICGRCGKEVEDENLFCTECGNAVQAIQKIDNAKASRKSNEFLEKINHYIDIFTDEKINVYLPVIAIILMIAIRLCGFIITAVLITLLNGYLLYCDYKRGSKINVKSLVLSVVLFLAALLVSI